MKELEEKLGYHFKNKSYLRTALTHSSYANETKAPGGSNERLEFLGDSILGWVVADYLFKHFPDLPEGDLTKKRAALVCEKACCGFSTQLNVGKYLLLSHGEQNSGGRTRSSILADAFESIIAAIYLDGGLEEARKFILRFVLPLMQSAKPRAFKDYKTMLQEIIQQNPEERLEYVLTGESGPDHDKHFTVEVHLNSNVIGKGGGRSKKEAEQQAAREALELMGY
ncbi:ribonuclease III [Caproiciproducens galactitolivorans]|uniref:Ribonuclease 3 n=1 Tax=Caproiciproducens galactitolivorans TaxID=642589 RepID=A0A4Z0Y571_9FIRM|nr:ribonuclease III [Caproiciproducens galactitolivorans]QEY34234.1 ribonuclease III [Caproiciproducens galactitolivorans]TGJ78007.1 ribonuclease 3 [Caproiciproducens galactitolivorans]